MKKEKEIVPKKFDSSKSPICISLCLGKFISGLHADFIVTKEDKYRGSFVTLSINDEPIAFFELEWAERVHPEDGLLDVRAKIIRKIKTNE